MAAENDNTTSRFELDGTEYDVPEFTDLEIDDWELVYDECKVVLADFAPIESEAKDAPKNAVELEAARLERLRNPRLEKSFLMIAYRRAHPDEGIDAIRSVIGKAKLIPLIESMKVEGEEEADDPTLTTEQEKPSDKSSVSPDGTSSPPSQKSSATPGRPLATTGTSG